MSAPPRIYAAWADLLERCGQGDDAVLDALAEGHWEPDAGTAQRFANLFNAAYSARKQRWLAGFARMQAVGTPLRSPQDFALLLGLATTNLGPLYRLTRLPALPAALRDTVQADLTQFVQDIGASLRDNIIRHGGNQREVLLLAVRSFGTPPVLPSLAPPEPAATRPPGRRIVF